MRRAEREWAWLGGAWLAVGLICALACGGPDDPQASGDCARDPATDPAEANGGDLEVRVGQFVSERNDQGDWVGSRFVSFEQKPTLELVHGFQGGSHVEPSLILPNHSKDGAEKTVAFQLRDGSGEVLTTKSCYSYGWLERESGSGTEMRNPRAVFKENPSQHVGNTVELIVDVTVEGEARKVIRRQLELVDEE